MKVLGVVTHNNMGGAQKAMAKLQAHVKEADFTIVYLYGIGEEGGMINGDVLVGSKKSLIVKHLLIVLRLFGYIRKEKPDVVISFLPLANVLVPLVAMLLGVRVRAISHRNPVWTYNWVLRWLDRLWGCWGIFTHVIANSEAVKSSVNHYSCRYRRKLVVIYNGISNVNGADDIDHVLDKYGISDKKYVAAIGRLSQQKRFDVLISALAEVKGVSLVIAGHGELYEELSMLAKSEGVDDRVYFLGALPHDDVIAIMRGAELYLQPSEFEGQSNSLLEAISIGSVVVSSNIDPQIEVLCAYDSEAGVIVESWDPSAWAESINNVLAIPYERDRLHRNALERSKDFSVEKMASSYLGVFKDALAE
ncbi:glycosyltransferase [Amphritea japonica]|uniref:Glycosyl transferase family 1 n=1 Tax=Amphritea japonica ATCC BAA-1530 TaxID=1278309 RepID=A0A7R6PL23_9GAMM|nr:glycosyltransferase [Amphritea japonica]BBB25453.1 glycosyl transferase family 1 [Amphritea japonica ATCC BAA-1530]